MNEKVTRFGIVNGAKSNRTANTDIHNYVYVSMCVSSNVKVNVRIGSKSVIIKMRIVLKSNDRSRSSWFMKICHKVDSF